jgi:hypothetical protein
MKKELVAILVSIVLASAIALVAHYVSRRPVPQTIGTKMVLRFTSDGISGVQTTYLAGDRKRTEYRNSRGRDKGPRLASINRCDIGQSFDLNMDADEYVSWPYHPKPPTAKDYAAMGLTQPKMVQSEKPTVRVTSNTVNTGEQKKFFGHIAKHFITTIKETPLEGSDSQPQESMRDGWHQESVRDGWYVDLDLALSCEPKFPKGTATVGFVTATKDGDPIDRPEFINTGDRPATGFPVELKVETDDTYVLPDGTKKQSHSRMENRVLQLYDGPLDAAIFEVPSGFKQVREIRRNPK